MSSGGRSKAVESPYDKLNTRNFDNVSNPFENDYFDRNSNKLPPINLGRNMNKIGFQDFQNTFVGETTPVVMPSSSLGLKSRSISTKVPKTSGKKKGNDTEIVEIDLNSDYAVDHLCKMKACGAQKRNKNIKDKSSIASSEKQKKFEYAKKKMKS